MDMPFDEPWIGVPHGRIAPVARGAIDGNRSQDHFLSLCSLVQILKSARVCLRARCHTVARTPGPGDALFEYSCKDCVAARTGRRNKDRHIALGGRVVEKRLVASAVHTVNCAPARTRTLDPYGCVARVTRIAVNAKRDHSKPLRA